MNRIIKFKAFHNGKMIYRGLHDRNWYTSDNKLVQGVHPLDYHNLKVMQFTGYKDIDGKEIYEGDILGDWNDCDGKMVESRQTVYFDESLGCWMLDQSLNQDQTYSSSLFENLNDFLYKIVGNIYENAELLVKVS